MPALTRTMKPSELRRSKSPWKLARSSGTLIVTPPIFMSPSRNERTDKVVVEHGRRSRTSLAARRRLGGVGEAHRVRQRDRGRDELPLAEAGRAADRRAGAALRDPVEERLQVERGRACCSTRATRTAGRCRRRSPPSGEKMLTDWKCVGCERPRSKSAKRRDLRHRDRRTRRTRPTRGGRSRSAAPSCPGVSPYHLCSCSKNAVSVVEPDIWLPSAPTRMPLASVAIRLATLGSGGSAAPGPRAAASRSPRARRGRRRPSRRASAARLTSAALAVGSASTAVRSCSACARLLGDELGAGHRRRRRGDVEQERREQRVAVVELRVRVGEPLRRGRRRAHSRPRRARPAWPAPGSAS